jgi:hypothetical protein
MPFRKLIVPLLAMALASTGCHARIEHESRSSVTVKLPPARAATPRPGFSFDSLDGKQASSDAG